MATPLTPAEIAAVRAALDNARTAIAAIEAQDESVAGRLTPVQVSRQLHVHADAIRALAGVVRMLVRYIVGTPPPA
ncbi:MAG TPA: hypothetical protein VFJ85_02815 [Acidimicrobiales bacterium]|nr:hypothetical protein [Acidimicrobiales bacterium]